MELYKKKGKGRKGMAERLKNSPPIRKRNYC